MTARVGGVKTIAAGGAPNLYANKGGVNKFVNQGQTGSGVSGAGSLTVLNGRSPAVKPIGGKGRNFTTSGAGGENR